MNVLQRVADGDVRRLMIFMPPRHGKSLCASRLFPAYYLARYPHRFAAITGYGDALARTHARAAREYVRDAGIPIRDDSRAVSHFETVYGGGCWSAGVGGPLTGKGFHLGIIDDPIKNAEEAASETIREKQREWYGSTFYTREEPGGAVVLIQTRWSESDLGGWLLQEERAEDGEAEGWHVLSLPALAEPLPDYPASCTVETDERAEGEPLCPERYPVEKLRRLKARIGEYHFASLYQQRPGPREGNLFKRSWLPIVDASPVVASRVRYWDKAASVDGDQTAGVLMARSAEKIFYVEDCVCGRWPPGERDAVILQTAQLDRERGHVSIVVEQEPGSGGKESALSSIRLLAGFDVRAERASGDKTVRAAPLAAQAEAGNVRLVRGAWNSAYLEELCAFPMGKHDDQVDASAAAFNRLAPGSWVIS